MKSIIPLKPHASHKVWGGSLLSSIKNIEVSEGQDPVGETWEISAHKDGPSLSSYGPLNEVSNLEEIPYLVKLIDTSENLSVQVHPGDEYAQKFENSKGKSECWVILDAKEGAGIYLGLKNGITKNSLKESLEKKEDLSLSLKFYPVSRGDFFYVPAGTIHAIGKDVFLAEVQQCSDITYRVWDWNRLWDGNKSGKNGEARELHIDKSLDVIRFDEEFNHPLNFKIQNNIFANDLKLLELSDFELYSYNKVEESELELSFGERISSILVLEGEISIKRNSEKYLLRQYEAALMPLEGTNNFKVSGKGIFLVIK
ncbi:type I phosphomannose isomerase catalytic subunit [Halobacteriovorax sp. JY17]|uniref:type I phosphomannose isomerase catalytic subunit n=1 Tax=Halobacteriovorax sp. JY17 TaxID=2014617 RepID=UPI000C42CC63|nr:type I phosphomannose isomerase catalytic subunit [Halobacteriovorax sp. JY17]PIK13812.1 MAG: hypothetical protein CES88_12555 [Halobacteriovorax sp. JY17]